jgi:hypothetical protein
VRNILPPFRVHAGKKVWKGMRKLCMPAQALR